MRGTRVSVETVLANLRDNPSYEDLLRGYPDISMDDVRACFAYAETRVRRVRRVRREDSPTTARSAVA
ncbi:MAG: DUF433 domain-containing protein [Dehalococcoidia bacterium]